MPPIITTSDSCNTLVDANDGNDLSKEQSIFSTTYEPLYVPTHLYRETRISLPQFPQQSQSISSSGCKPSHREYLTFPSSGDELHDVSSIHDHLTSHPVIKTLANDALDGPVVGNLRRSLDSVSSSSASPILYIHQREVGHVTTKQYNNNGAILATDSATTCHIVAIRTSFPTCTTTTTSVNSDKGVFALSSLTHLDSANNGSCLEKMFDVHATEARRQQRLRRNKNRRRSSIYSNGDNNDEPIVFHMDIHVVGGYNDEKGQSKEITNHIFDTLDTVSREHSDCLAMTIQTCIVSELNDVRNHPKHNFTTASYDNKLGPNIGPIIRGFALDTSDGSTHFLSRVSESQRGPDSTLRRVRLWSSSDNSQELLVVHRPDTEGIRIPSFDFGTFAQLEAFLMLSDDVILQYTSTSPECEDLDYCHLVRKTCRYLRDETPHSSSRVWNFVDEPNVWSLAE